MSDPQGAGRPGVHAVRVHQDHALEFPRLASEGREGGPCFGRGKRREADPGAGIVGANESYGAVAQIAAAVKE